MERLVLVGVIVGIVTIASVASKKFPLAVELTMCAVTILLGFGPIFVAQWAESGGHTTLIVMGAYTDEYGAAHNMEQDVWVPTKCGSLGLDFSAPGLMLGSGALLFALTRKKTPA